MDPASSQVARNLFVAKPEILWKPPGARAVFGGQARCRALGYSGRPQEIIVKGLEFRVWGFPKIRGTLLGIPIIRIIVYWGLYEGTWETTIRVIVIISAVVIVVIGLIQNGS